MDTEDEKEKKEAKMELVSITSELMPQGSPNYTKVTQYPTIDRLGQEVGKKGVLMMIFTLVRDMCNNLNVVRNMNEDQMLEAASMLLDECGNFRLEDYVMMFSLAKRGQLVKILDRMDIDIIGQMMDKYWEARNMAGKRASEEKFVDYETQLKELARKAEPLSEEEEKIQQDLMSKLKDTAVEICTPSVEQQREEEVKRMEKIRAHIDFFKRNLTPEQIAEIDARREEIQAASKKYEEDQKERGLL